MKITINTLYNAIMIRGAMIAKDVKDYCIRLSNQKIEAIKIITNVKKYFIIQQKNNDEISGDNN